MHGLLLLNIICRVKKKKMLFSTIKSVKNVVSMLNDNNAPNTMAWLKFTNHCK